MLLLSASASYTCENRVVLLRRRRLRQSPRSLRTGGRSGKRGSSYAESRKDNKLFSNACIVNKLLYAVDEFQSCRELGLENRMSIDRRPGCRSQDGSRLITSRQGRWSGRLGDYRALALGYGTCISLIATSRFQDSHMLAGAWVTLKRQCGSLCCAGACPCSCDSLAMNGPAVFIVNAEGGFMLFGSPTRKQ